eukprot:CAMPEP_0171099500 /NCGR_PEP_ID=MMETSP0766_2-20121228/51700_1 /TAXON_ID=439317 /ORGANISM="Gambierdiscus australes, Strain CAWD 149" /LENGTH=91 /DNA_ID=CAMNT_0011559135 /DNA_START=842 /DNA_END=1113 /DNA_ORIENTATION=+
MLANCPRVCCHCLEVGQPRQQQQELVCECHQRTKIRQGQPRKARPFRPEPGEQDMPYDHPICEDEKCPSEQAKGDAKAVQDEPHPSSADRP